MIRQFSPPGGQTIFCDDIRQEVNGKLTLVGVYGPQMIILGSFPISIPVLNALIYLRVGSEQGNKACVVRVIREAETDEILAEFKLDIPELDIAVQQAQRGKEDSVVSFAEMRIPVRLSLLTFKEHCRLKVRAYIEDDEIRLGVLDVVIGAIESASGDAGVPSPL